MEISLFQAQSILGPYHGQLLGCVDEGWKQYSETLPFRLPLISPRGQANAVHEFMAEEARRRLGALDGVHIDESTDNRFLINVRNRLLLRFKKLDKKLRTSNYPTQTALDFDAQREIDGLPECARLTIGYQLDRMRRNILGTYVVFGVSREPEWYYDLRDPAIQEVVELPIERTRKVADGGDRRVKGKQDDQHDGAVGRSS